jgi:hypothetical protein
MLLANAKENTKANIGFEMTPKAWKYHSFPMELFFRESGIFLDL